MNNASIYHFPDDGVHHRQGHDKPFLRFVRYAIVVNDRHMKLSPLQHLVYQILKLLRMQVHHFIGCRHFDRSHQIRGFVSSVCNAFLYGIGGEATEPYTPDKPIVDNPIPLIFTTVTVDDWTEGSASANL